LNSPDPMTETVNRLLQERQKIKTVMGGAARVAAIHNQGQYTAREWIGRLVDENTFVEIGTFVKHHQAEKRSTTPGDGKIGGHARVSGRPVTVIADDVTVMAGSDGHSAMNRINRLYDQALEFGNPYVHFGQGGGGRIPDVVGSGYMGHADGIGPIGKRDRRIPMVTAIVGRSYGTSSFNVALSDFSVQVQGASMSVTSPRVIEVATAEKITDEDLGGATVHAEKTGQIDLAVESNDAAITAIKGFLSYLPDNANMIPPRASSRIAGMTPALRTLVPEDRRRGYDMRKVLRGIVDGGELFELRPRYGRSLITSLARINGHSVGILASQPMQQGGALTPEACDKATRFLTMCDSFSIPIVFLADSPGFLVGRSVEHNRLLFKVVLLNQAIAKLRVPMMSIVVRKAFGLAYFCLGGGQMGSVLHCAWPGAEIGFMDPEVAANVVYAPKLAALDAANRATEMARLADSLRQTSNPYDPAATMGVDEVIDPAETPVILAGFLDRLMPSFDPKRTPSALALWPTCL